MTATMSVELRDWTQADLALRRMGECDVEIARVQAELAEAVTNLKSAAAAHVDTLVRIRKTREAELAAFAKAHREELSGKSRRLTHGVLGFRKGRARIALAWKAARVIEALKQRELAGCIRVKESLNKDALLTLDDGQLADVGCRRVQGRDRFFAEPDVVQVQDEGEVG